MTSAAPDLVSGICGHCEEAAVIEYDNGDIECYHCGETEEVRKLA